MNLSELVFKVVKNVKYLDDTNFLYDAFLNGDFDDDPDYKNSINNAMSPINEAIHRLSDRNKIRFKTYNIGRPFNHIVNLPEREELIPHNFGEGIEIEARYGVLDDYVADEEGIHTDEETVVSWEEVLENFDDYFGTYFDFDSTGEIYKLKDEEDNESLVFVKNVIIRKPYLNIKKIVNIFYFADRSNSEYVSTSFRELNQNQVWVEDYTDRNLVMQYMEDIESFNINDIYNEETDVDLQDFGISETMCDYIVEYAQGKLQETIAPELANLHLSRAEQYFADLEDQQTPFTKQVVKRKYKINA